MAFQDHYRKRVSYFYDREVGNNYFGKNHPMKPHRLAITHNLIMNYNLYAKMSIYTPFKASAEDMKQFHGSEYVEALRGFGEKAHHITEEISRHLKKFQIGTKENDCPLFEGLFSFCQISTGGSLAAAINLNKGDSDIAINWAGGLHHAKKSEASGFCYVNDIVLGIVELLKYNQRVLYIDIDVHHGDGVEEAFYVTDRVMTVSFHRYGHDFFPFTGGNKAIGAGKGKHYALNIPLKAGMDDFSYERIFTPIMKRVNEYYQPNVIVLQCGADSLTGDRLGDFNLTLKGHGKCVELIRSFNVPLMLLGGGGYTVKNVSRCWTYETAIALNMDISNHLPNNDYLYYFSPDLQLHIPADSNLKNSNTNRDLEDAISRAFDKLSNIQPVPSVQIQETSGSSSILMFGENEDEADLQREQDKRVTLPNEFYDEY